MQESASLLEILSKLVPDARLDNGLPIRDATDFRIWLEECAQKIERAGVTKAIRELVDATRRERDKIA